MKQLISVVLVLSVIIPSLAFAQTTNNIASLQQQLQALLQQLSQLQNQANGNVGTPISMPQSDETGTAGTTFTRNLTVGSQGPDVSDLQQILIRDRYLTTVSTPTGYFGPSTKTALIAYQQGNGISPATGYFGPLTMADIESKMKTHQLSTSVVTNQSNSATESRTQQTLPESSPSVTTNPTQPTSSSQTASSAASLVDPYNLHYETYSIPLSAPPPPPEPTPAFPSFNSCGTVKRYSSIVSVPVYSFSTSQGVIESSQLQTTAQISYYISDVYDSNSPTNSWFIYGTSTDALNATTSGQTVSIQYLNGSHVTPTWQAVFTNVVPYIPYYYRMVFQNSTSGQEVAPASNTVPCSFTIQG